MKRALFIVLGLILVAIVVIQARSVQANAGAAPAAPHTAPLAASINAEGRVTTYPGAQVVVSTDFAGTITRLLVDEKSHVHAGDVIAEIRANDVHASIDQSLAQVNEANADIQLAEVELERAQQLYAGQVGTKQAVDRAQRDLDSARARRDTALADSRRLEATLVKSVIRAPITGTVILRHVQPGESVKEQTPIVTIADLTRVRIEGEVDEFDSGHVHIGAPVTVRAEGYDAQSWRAVIEEIPDSVVPRRLKPEDPGRPTDTRVLIVKVALQEPTPLKLGQRVELEISRQK